MGNSIDNAFDIEGLNQDHSNSIADALELLQSSSKPTIFTYSVLFIAIFDVANTALIM